jgi:uncharacterized damage-inducible protein DinB
MTDQPPVHDRAEPPFDADERAMLEGWLDYHRATLAMKCAGLDDEQLRLRAVPPSALSLLGLVRHMTEVERHWFRRVLEQRELPDVYCTPDDPDADFDHVEDADGGHTFVAWREEVAAAREAAARVADLASGGVHHGRAVSLRWVLTHMVEEYARHNGHADLLRERIDGVVGD